MRQMSIALKVARLVSGQLLLAFMVFLAGRHWGEVQAVCAGAGALIAVTGSAYFSWQVFKSRASGDPRIMLRATYRGLAGKLVLVAVGFLMAFRYIRPMSAGALFVGFAVVQAVAWVYPLWLEKRGLL